MDITRIFYSFLQFIAFYITFHFFLNISFKPDKRDIAAFCIIILSLFRAQDFVIFSWVLEQLLYLGYAITYRERRLTDRFLLYCISYMTVAMFYFTSGIALPFLIIVFDHELTFIICNFVAITLLLCIFLLTPYRRLYDFISQSFLTYKILSFTCYPIVAAVSFMMTIYSFGIKRIFLILFVTATIITAYIVFQRLFSEHQQLASYRKNLPIYKSLIDEIRAGQHEFSNRIQNLEQLPYICKDYDSICAALLKNTRNYQKPLRAYSLLQLNMPLLAATLYNLYMQAGSRNITILFDISSPNIESHAPEYELSDLISILTQNAIEACKSGDTIYTRIVSAEGRLLFEIRNPIERQLSITELSKFFQKNFSTKTKHAKKDGLEHGLGLYYLSNKITLYKGSIGVDCAQYDDRYWIIFSLEV